jgi:hypothetical protein
MSSIGDPLYTAKSPRQFMTAVLDAILGELVVHIS